jgi:hypothetical protein
VKDLTKWGVDEILKMESMYSEQSGLERVPESSIHTIPAGSRQGTPDEGTMRKVKAVSGQSTSVVMRKKGESSDKYVPIPGAINPGID